MNWQGNVIVFGSFGIVAALFVGGFFVPHPFGAIMIGAGIIGAVVWLITMFNLMVAMNSDI